ncbi:MAG: ATP-binding cassette domain-containing protein [Bacteroidia bacterium]|nr:ATP-binding cassette domain-containing protein [Bacteroidia bacterium]
MGDQIVLRVNNLRKNYKQIQALKGVSFDVPQGCVFGILGPNGSGKTTLLGVILDILKDFSGSYSWEGFSSNAHARKKLGAFLETPNFYHYLSAEANLKIVAGIKELNHPDIPGVLKKVGLFDRRKSKFSTYSLGMKQRLAIASSLLSNPDIIVLDEPTNGLDPEGIVEIRDLINTLREEGKTLIIASHLLDEVEKVCTHVAILKKGELLSSGPVQQILNQDPTVIVSAKDNQVLADVLRRHPSIKSVSMVNSHVEASFTSYMDPADLNTYCFEQSITLTHLAVNTQRLESAFLELIKE